MRILRLIFAPLEWSPTVATFFKFAAIELIGAVVMIFLIMTSREVTGMGQSEPTPVDPVKWSELAFFALAVFIAPLVETFLCQFSVYETVSALTRSKYWPVLISWVVFAALHFGNSIQSGLIAGLVGGYVLACTYAVFRKRSRKVAFCVTCGLHIIWNGKILVLVAI